MDRYRKDRRLGKMDKEAFSRAAARHQIIRCTNGHYNTTTAKQCWKCGAWIAKIDGGPRSEKK